MDVTLLGVALLGVALLEVTLLGVALLEVTLLEVTVPGSNLFNGTLDLLILRSLIWGPLHGYGIGRWIRQTSSEILSIEEGALYPALHRMQKKGWLECDWGRTDTGRQAKFYSMTDAGQEHLSQETKRWEEHASAVHSVLQGSREAESS